jgi:PAS domain S-box-containing protein
VHLLPDVAVPESMNAQVSSLPCGVVTFMDDGVIVEANGTLAQLLGYAVDELRGLHVERLLTVAGRIFYQTHLFPMLRLHGRAEEIFLLLRHRDGSDIGALSNAVRVERNGVHVTDCVLLQVRERRKYEDELLRARREAEGANAALAARTRELEDTNGLLTTQTHELEQQQIQLEEQTTELEAQSEELRVINEDLVARSEELEQAREIAEEANRAKSQFLATMSHELRTPLNAIGGYAELIALGIHGPVTAAQLEALDRVTRSQRHLLRLINEVLNLARIEAGRLDYRVDTLRMDEVIASVVPMVEPQMANAHLTFSYTVESGLEAAADRDKVQQVLINLLTNALKFTAADGCVTVDAVRAPDGQSVHTRVRDTGIGIPAEKLASIFDPFVQVDSRHARQAEGSGLGLAISRDLARGMHGDLTAESEVGVGSTFTLRLPAVALGDSR